MKKQFLLAAGIVAVAGLLLTGCSTTGGGGAASTTAPGCAPYAKYGTLKNKTVTMYSGIVAPLATSYINSFKKFESCTGITVQFQGDTNFDSQIKVRIAGGNAPDLAVFAQPGQIKSLVGSKNIVQAPKGVAGNVNKFWSSSWKDYVEINGKIYGSPVDANVKSLVWYQPSRFKAAGYKIPTTLAQLKKLSDTIVASGAKPWCEGISAGSATGWPITDWMSQMMLIQSGPATYDKWVNNQIPFTAKAPKKALAEAGDFLKNSKYMNGGLGDVSSIAATTWTDAGVPVLSGKCAMYKQGSFQAGIFPKGTTVSPTGDVYAFYFPGVNTKTKPVLGGGDFLVAFSKRPEVQAFQTFMSSDTWANAMVAASPDGGWVTANTGMDNSKLTNPIDKLSAQILQDPKSVFRYSAADQMPPAVQAVFWAQSTKWILGQSTSDTLSTIQKSWANQ